MAQAICCSESLSGCFNPSGILMRFVNSFLRERYTVPLWPARRPYQIRPLFTGTRRRTVISARCKAAPRGFRKWSVTCRIGSVPRFAAVSLRTADLFPVVASLPREATTGNASAVLQAILQCDRYSDLSGSE